MGNISIGLIDSMHVKTIKMKVVRTTRKKSFDIVRERKSVRVEEKCN